LTVSATRQAGRDDRSAAAVAARHSLVINRTAKLRGCMMLRMPDLPDLRAPVARSGRVDAHT
jgi:hypothetical protein